VMAVSVWQARMRSSSPPTSARPRRAVQREWPRLTKVRAQVIFDTNTLASLVSIVRREKATRQQEIDETTEDSMDRMYTCVGCSPFAPDHMCVVTPQRPPQCTGRSR